MTTTDNRLIARWTLLLCALALTFFTGYLAAPPPVHLRAQPDKTLHQVGIVHVVGASHLGPRGCSWAEGTLKQLGAAIWVDHICAINRARGAEWEVLGGWHHHTNCLILRGDASVIKCGSWWDVTGWGI